VFLTCLSNCPVYIENSSKLLLKESWPLQFKLLSVERVKESEDWNEYPSRVPD
jgi:hypothetical protein